MSALTVCIGRRQARLEDQHLLGVGGEARVYAWEDLAVKVYHPIDDRLPPAEQAAAARRRGAKLAKLADFPEDLPDAVVGPLELATDERDGQLVGFAMRRVRSAEDLRRLSQRRWREAVVSNAAVCRLFARLRSVLQALHRRGVVVGDLNDGNVLFSGEHPWLIDADSMQFDGHPCPVAHERFLDPRLFGVDLESSAVFTPETDWYAFAVLLFSSLLYTHPYGGVYPRYQTLLRRAQARYSVLRRDVRYPKGAVPLSILPDPLLAWFEGVFDGDRREAVPAGLLDVDWTVCPSCGLCHARSACPACRRPHQRPALASSVAGLGRPEAGLVQRGSCRVQRVFTTRGRILVASVQGRLRYLYEEDGVVRRESGHPVMAQSLEPGMRFAISGDTTWVGCADRLVAVRQGRITARASCATLGTAPVFDANAQGCYALDGGWLVELDSGRRFGQLLPGLTWFRTGPRLGFGYYRAGRVTIHFLFDVGRPGLRMVTLPPIRGRLVDAHATSDDGGVLFERAVEHHGRMTHAIFVIGADGRLVAECSGRPDDAPQLAQLGGKAIVGDRILCATDDGLMSLVVDRGGHRLAAGTRFVDTEPFSSTGATLLPAVGGAVYVVTTQEIQRLSLETRPVGTRQGPLSVGSGPSGSDGSRQNSRGTAAGGEP